MHVSGFLSFERSSSASIDHYFLERNFQATSSQSSPITHQMNYYASAYQRPSCRCQKVPCATPAADTVIVNNCIIDQVAFYPSMVLPQPIARGLASLSSPRSFFKEFAIAIRSRTATCKVIFYTSEARYHRRGLAYHTVTQLSDWGYTTTRPLTVGATQLCNVTAIPQLSASVDIV